MGRTIICCHCDEHYGGDPLACAKAIASGTKTPCGCDCHRAEDDGSESFREAIAVLHRLAGMEPNENGHLHALGTRIRWLVRCEKAIESMAAQFIHPKTTAEEMVDQILRAPE